jgi:type I restriction enzyme S subunit
MSTGSAWPEVTIKDVCSAVQYGYTASASSDAPGPHFLRITDIVPGFVEWPAVPRCEISASDHRKFKLSDGDIVVARTGATVGYGKLLRNPPDAVFASYLVRFRVRSDVDARFVGAIVESAAYKAWVKGQAGGAAQPNANAQVLSAFPLRLPPLPMQRRIASILGAYDDLIEVNRRRIAVLEEMARRLFEEWFVRFRFPGHAALPIKQVGDELVPEGWSLQSIGEAFNLLGGGTPSKAEPEFWNLGEVEWYTPSDITGSKTVFMDRSSLRISRVGLQRSSAQLFPPFSVMMTSRATIGAIAINTTAASTNQGFITCLPNDSVPLTFMYHWLHFKVPVFIAHGTGATFKEITKGVFRRLPIVVPPAGTTAEFEKRCRPILDAVLVLERCQRRLAESRDLLLPRLISGDLSFTTAERELEAVA